MKTSDWNILLVDDEEEFVLTLAERLGLRGIRVRTALDGQAALELIAAEEPHVAVLDVMMPGMRGLELLQRIRRDFTRVQVILLTGQGSTKDGIEGMRQGAFDYMMKPLNIDLLITKIGEALAGDKPAGA